VRMTGCMPPSRLLLGAGQVWPEKMTQVRSAHTATATPKDGRRSRTARQTYRLPGAEIEIVLAGLPAGAAELATRLTTRLTRLGFVDREGPACELRAIESLNSGFSRLALGHLDKPKAFRAARVTVGNHIDLVHGTILLEELAEVMIRCTKRKVAYKDIHAKIL
jgi:hypothetical protein